MSVRKLSNRDMELGGVVHNNNIDTISNLGLSQMPAHLLDLQCIGKLLLVSFLVSPGRKHSFVDVSLHISRIVLPHPQIVSFAI